MGLLPRLTWEKKPPPRRRSTATRKAAVVAKSEEPKKRTSLLDRILWRGPAGQLPPPPERAAEPPKAKRGKAAIVVSKNGHKRDDDDEEDDGSAALAAKLDKLDKSIDVLVGDALPIKRHSDLTGQAVILFSYFEMMARAATLTGKEDDVDLMEIFEFGFEERMLSKDGQSLKLMREVLVAQLVQMQEEAEANFN